MDCKRAAKVGRGERGDLGGHAQLHGRVVKRSHRIADTAQERRVLGNQVVMQIKAADGHHKHLALGAQAAARANQARHHLQLVAQGAGGERCGQRHARQA